uniref:Uncharacterized protein n=1 Tax=Aegilops tauschii subsp. strangulata TaxID=200361 RepID=A0A453RQH2_AEGTS
MTFCCGRNDGRIMGRNRDSIYFLMLVRFKHRSCCIVQRN